MATNLLLLQLCSVTTIPVEHRWSGAVAATQPIPPILPHFNAEGTANPSALIMFIAERAPEYSGTSRVFRQFLFNYAVHEIYCSFLAGRSRREWVFGVAQAYARIYLVVFGYAQFCQERAKLRHVTCRRRLVDPA